MYALLLPEIVAPFLTPVCITFGCRQSQAYVVRNLLFRGESKRDADWDQVRQGCAARLVYHV